MTRGSPPGSARGLFSWWVAGPEFAARRRTALSSAVSRASEQVWSASHPPRRPCRESDPAQRGAPPRRRRALRRVVLREGLSRGRYSQRVACLEFTARRREAPRGLCSSAIRCRGQRKMELPKLHAARPRATGRHPTPAEALRRIVPCEGMSRGYFRLGRRAPNLPRGAVRCRARCVPMPFGGVDPRKPV